MTGTKSIMVTEGPGARFLVKIVGACTDLVSA